MARLLGSSSATKISRYESFRRYPSVITTFAYEIVFSEPARKLFAGYYEAVRRDVHARAHRLMRALATEAKDDLRTARKIALLRSIVETKPLRPDRASR
jgi:hypothetical protein